MKGGKEAPMGGYREESQIASVSEMMVNRRNDHLLERKWMIRRKCF
jgi:hypothetical protein